MPEKIWLSTPTIHGEEQLFVKEAFDTNWVAPLGKNVTSARGICLPSDIKMTEEQQDNIIRIIKELF